MVKFLDGPAAGAVLMLRHAPLYLRAVIEDNSIVAFPRNVPTWDALDHPHDTAKDIERIVVYKRVGETHSVHVRMAKGSGFYSTGEYRVVDPAPSDEGVRKNANWVAWVRSQEIGGQ